MVKQATKTDTNNQISKNDKTTALKVVLNIFEKWSCSEKEQMVLLGSISRSTLQKWKKNPHDAQIGIDLLDRISYLLNIHQALGIIFSNKKNVYTFMHMKNHNPPFNGKTPMEFLSEGHMNDLIKVHKHIDSLRGGQW